MQPGGGERCLEVRSRQNKFIEGKEELEGKAIGSFMVSCSLSFVQYLIFLHITPASCS